MDAPLPKSVNLYIDRIVNLTKSVTKKLRVGQIDVFAVITNASSRIYSALFQ